MMQLSGATPILKFQFSKASKKWSQILCQYLKRNTESVRTTWFASQENLIFCIESKNKTTKAILTIPSYIIPNYHIDMSQSNYKLKTTKGYICSIKPINMESFLMSTQNLVVVTIQRLKLIITYTQPEGSNTFSSKLLEIDENSTPFEQLQGEYQCQLSITHNSNNILQSVYSVCHNFKCKQVVLYFDDLNNHLTLTFVGSEDSQPIEIGTIVQVNNKYLKRPRKYNAKMFASGLLSLEKCDSVDLCFSSNMIVFVSRFKEGFCYKYYLAEMEFGEEN